MTSGRSVPVEVMVVAAAIIERDGAYLLTKRLPGTHLAGCWEFPGGKQHEGETLHQCLVRELREELACEITVGPLVVSTRHDYPERSVCLHFFSCTLQGEPEPQDGQQMQWVPRDSLCEFALPEADKVLVDLLTGTGASAGSAGLPR